MPQRQGPGFQYLAIMKSTDGGASWTRLPLAGDTQFVADTSFYSFFVDPQNPATLFLSSGRGIFSSPDSGGTWTRLYLTSASYGMEKDPAGTLFAGRASGLMKSTNGGSTWSSADAGVTGSVGTIALDPLTPSTLYISTGVFSSSSAIYKSTDGAGSWVLLTSDLPFVNSWAIDSSATSTLYAGTDLGAFKSTDGGLTWSMINRGVYKSLDAGETWASANQGRYFDPGPFSGTSTAGSTVIAMDPSNRLTLFSGWRSRSLSAPVLHYDKSVDGGANWTFLAHSAGGLNAISVDDLLVAPFSSSILFAIENGLLRKSVDGGRNWLAANTALGTVSRVVADATAAGVLYATSLTAVFKSIDGGDTWSSVFESASLRTVAIDPIDSSKVYAGGVNRFARSADAGRTWTSLTPNIPPGLTGVTGLTIQSIAIDPKSSGTIYIGTDGGVYRTMDAGPTWDATTMSIVIPTLTSITPAVGGRGSRVAVTLAGTGFSSTLSLDAGREVSVTDVRFVSTTVATATFAVSPSSAPGAHLVTLRTDAGTSNALTFSVPSPRQADFDGDGASDVVLRSTSGQTTELLMNGTRVASQKTLLSDPSWEVSLSGDFNGDGKSDLLWYNPSTHETVAWLMDGATLRSWASLLTHPQWQVVKTGDFNGDGKADLVWYNTQSGETVLWLMDGLNLLSWASENTDLNKRIIAIADFDGDGKSDLLWFRSDTGETSVWLMAGTAARVKQVLLEVLVWQVISTGDFNGDGKADLLWRNAVSGEVVTWLMNGVALQGWASLSGSSQVLKAIADFNGDGKDDLLWYDPASGQTSSWIMNGATVSRQRVLFLDPFWSVIGTRDFNADGKADLLWKYSLSEEYSIWLMNGETLSSYGNIF